MMFGNGQHPWDAVGCAGGGEYELVNAGIEQLQERERLADIVVEVLARLFDRFADIGVSRKMNGRSNAKAFDRLSYQRPVADIAHHQRSPFHRPAVTGAYTKTRRP